MKKENVLPVVLGGAALIGGGWYLWDRYQKKQKSQLLPPPAPGAATGMLPAPSPAAPAVFAPSQPASGQAAGASPQFNPSKVLKLGSKGTEVKMIQRAINDVYRDILKQPTRLDVDGVFGNQTLTAVRAITGKDKTTYAQIKQFKREAYKAKGLPDPYMTQQQSYSAAVSTVDPIGAFFGLYD